MRTDRIKRHMEDLTNVIESMEMSEQKAKLIEIKSQLDWAISDIDKVDRELLSHLDRTEKMLDTLSTISNIKDSLNNLKVESAVLRRRP